MAKSGRDVWFLPFADSSFQYESRPFPEKINKLPPLLKNKDAPGIFEWARLIFRFRERVRESKPDLIHAGPVQTGAFVASICKSTPLLVVSWGSDVLVFPDKNRWMRWITKFTLKRADMVLGDCDAVRERVLSLSPLRDEQVVFFPWGIDVQQFTPRKSKIGLRKKLNWENFFVVISTRAFEPIHGPFVFLEAIKRAKKSRSNIRVIMLGDGSLRSRVEKFIDENELARYIHLPGQMPNHQLVDYFNEADLYVSATFSDGTSVSLLEAMGCGLPVVVVDEYGNREWVAPGKNGWLYPSGDAEILGETILQAYQKRREREKMSLENRMLVEKQANWTKNVVQLFDAYDRLLG